VGDFLSFRRMLTPIIIQVVYWVVTVGVVLAGLALLGGGDTGGQRFGGLLVILLGPIGVRIYAEILIVIFKINETLTEIRHNTQPGRPQGGASIETP